MEHGQIPMESFVSFVKRSGSGLRGNLGPFLRQEVGFGRLVKDSEDELLKIAEERRPEVNVLPNGLTLFIMNQKLLSNRIHMPFIYDGLYFSVPRTGIGRGTKSPFKLCIKSGNMDGKISGLAHLTEHLVCSHRLDEKLRKMSVVSNGTIKFFETFYPRPKAVAVSKTALRPMIESYFEEFSNIDFSRMEWELKRMNVEKLQDMSHPMYEANRLFDKKLGWDTETDKDTDGISESMVREFMREHYVPSNMILMAKDDPEMLRFVEALPRGRIMKDESRFAPNLPRARGRKLVTRKLDHIYVSNVSFWFAAPQSVAVKERTLIELGGMIIKERIVDASLKDIVSHGSGCNYSANRAFGSFELSIRQIHPTDSGLAMKLIEREVERVKRDVTDEEFERAKKKTIEQVKDSLEDGEVGSYFDEVLYNYDDVVTTIKSLFSATKENVMETMLEYLDLNDCMVVVTEPGAEQS